MVGVGVGVDGAVGIVRKLRRGAGVGRGGAPGIRSAEAPNPRLGRLTTLEAPRSPCPDPRARSPNAAGDVAHAPAGTCGMRDSASTKAGTNARGSNPGPDPALVSRHVSAPLSAHPPTRKSW